MMDYRLEDTINKTFTTRAFATSIPTVLIGTPSLEVYQDGIVTPITAGVSLGVDHNGRVGLNLLTVVATVANGFAAGDYSVVIAAGTVDGVSIVGETVYTFSIDKSAAAVDLANATDGLTALAAAVATRMAEASINTTGGAVDVVTLNTDMRGTDSAATAAQVTALNNFNPATDAVANVTLVATTTTNTDMRGTDGVDTSAMRGTDSAALPADVIAARDVVTGQGGAGPWTTGGGGSTATDSGTAQAGGASTITLRAGASSVNNTHNGQLVVITGGTGAGQSRAISNALGSYDGGTKIATIIGVWATNPDATSVYQVLPADISEIVPAPTLPELQAGLNDFNPATDIVASVNVVNTTTQNTDMRGTDGVDTAPMRGTDGANTVTPLTAVQAKAEVTQALVDIHLDHAYAVAYDPASKPGDAAAQWNVLVENDAGVPRFTANALEQAPSGTGASAISIRQEIDANSTQLAKLGVPAVDISADIASVLTIGGTGPWTTGAGGSGFNATDRAKLDRIDTDATTARLTNLDTSLASLSTFNPATDTVANVTNVLTNADMRGTDGANTVVPDNVSIIAIKAKTDQIVMDGTFVQSSVKRIGTTTLSQAGAGGQLYGG